MEIKFKSDDDLPLNKTLKLYTTQIVIGTALDKNNKDFLQVLLDE